MTRWSLLLLAILFVGIGGGTWWHSAGSSPVGWAGVLVRVGLMFGAIWIAWPQLESLRTRISSLILGTVLFLLMLVAIRPRIFPIAAAAALAMFLINGVIRRLSGNLPRRP